MKRLILQMFLIFVVMVSAGYAQNTTKTKELKVIDPFSEEYKNNLTIQKSSGILTSTPSRKVKYISTLTQETTESQASEVPYNSTISSQEITGAAQVKSAEGNNSSLLSNTTGEGSKENLKIFKSK